jgi:carbamoyltransferase
MGELELNPDVADFASSVQSSLEACLLELANGALRSLGTGNLCLAGGVALNCTANGRLHRLNLLDDLFVQPAAGDAGVAIGAALEVSHAAGDFSVPTERLQDVALEPSYTVEDIASTLQELGLSFDDCGGEAPLRAADALAAGKVVGWFSGRMEGEPRALGHRSIVADRAIPGPGIGSTARLSDERRGAPWRRRSSSSTRQATSSARRRHRSW